MRCASSCALLAAGGCGWYERSDASPSSDRGDGSAVAHATFERRIDAGAASPVTGTGPESGAACLAPTDDAFHEESLLPYFRPLGTVMVPPEYSVCGVASLSDGTLTLTKPGSCMSELYYIVLEPSRFVLCGDFDVQVDFDLLRFPVPVSNRWASFRISTTEIACWIQHVCPGVTLERYDDGASASGYKIWNTNANSPLTGGADAQGRFRVVRKGTDLEAYYFSNSAWVLGSKSTTSPNPMAIQFYTGSCSQGPCGAEDRVDQSVAFSHLRIGRDTTDVTTDHVPMDASSE